MALGSGTSSPALCISVLPNITNPIYIEHLTEMVPPPNHNTVGVCNHITSLIPYYISSRLVTPRKVIYAPTEVSDICALLLDSIQNLKN